PATSALREQPSCPDARTPAGGEFYWMPRRPAGCRGRAAPPSSAPPHLPAQPRRAQSLELRRPHPTPPPRPPSAGAGAGAIRPPVPDPALVLPSQPTPAPPHCLRCRYVLVGLESSTCPECGAPFDPADPSTYWSPTELTDRAKRLLSRPTILGCA